MLRAAARGMLFRRQMRTVCLALVVMFALSACDTIAYYAQAVQGQASLLLKREPIDELLADSSLDAELRHKLMLVQRATAYAEAVLSLPAEGSYQSYVDLQRRHMVWNVFAAPEFSIQPLSWCFPIAGCVSYRGYFAENAAQRYAERLETRGYDVFVGGVDAYSTLGWFNDPVPSTVMWRQERQLVELIFHELAHQRLYLAGDTAFNESFASFVGQEGLRRWLEDAGQGALYLQSQRELAVQQSFIEFVLDYRNQFASLYASGAEESDMRQQKQALQQQMYREWGEVSAESGAGYRAWFDGPLNNAQLSTVGSYYEWVPAFRRLFELNAEDFESFYQAVETLAGLPEHERRQQLAELMPPV